MRIPDDIEDLALAFMEPEKKKGLFRMTRDEIDAVLLGEIPGLVTTGYLEPCTGPGQFPYSVTPRGREILQILSPCKRGDCNPFRNTVAGYNKRQILFFFGIDRPTANVPGIICLPIDL